MVTVYTLPGLFHLIGLSLAVGSATVKLVLLSKCNSDHESVSTFIRISKPVTKIIFSGLILITLSGIGWLIAGYSFTPMLIVKLVLVGLVWVIGPIIDNGVEPKFIKLAPKSGENPSPAAKAG
ncbi:MAG: hypothetical protein A2X05_04045 [Bacteroidetes bacterium GWE2_41_25]|nr:MAG: hypothetical protein A2X03_06160 [Bacteroidetes bacterium GWA2_40_15]OFX85871.1 MAG: hypothetical protein A2X06_16030 [Bacteroidetes bacterium GWC2_40_22]OFY06116.1 MAG: hypothetical protein A2X05_04045 [Bacteroidetes bacterium GWE2_41_25]OFY60508.1 MAG: hypothetical protein A2X04_00845 [Bacteroidetes bacterium GWF2_41_9]HAM10184.1 hypothetical protein [Bacteroidales bacterium]